MTRPSPLVLLLGFGAAALTILLLYELLRPELVARRSRPLPMEPGFSPVTDSVLRTAARNPGDWVMYGRDFANTRFSPLSQINSRTIRRLRPAWIHQAGGMPGQQQSTPIVFDGVLYYTAPFSVVIAVNARTGAELWRYRHDLRDRRGCCGGKNRGLAIYEDKVYLAAADARLVALERRTGALVWQVEIADPDSGYSETMAPLAVGGRIIVGASGGDQENAIRGFVDAYDAQTGARLWRFWTVPSPEEGGWWGRWVSRTPDGELHNRDIAREKADSAKHADAWQRGGGSVWTTPAYDPELDLLYVGVGNPAPQVEGSVRPGDNLYTASIVAIEAATGKLRWYQQLIPHDEWDYDAANPPIIAEAIKGRPAPALAHAGKLGWVYLFDRRTGNRLLRSEAFVPQLNLFAPRPQKGSITLPTGSGGANWMPSAYDPRTGLMYVLGFHHPSVLRSNRVAEGPVAGWTDAEGMELRNNHGSILSAVDLGTGEIRWRRGHKCEAVGLVTAGDLTFCGSRATGLLKGIDSRNGDVLWRFRVGGSIEAGPITYALGGHQYLAVTASSALIAFELAP